MCTVSRPGAVERLIDSSAVSSSARVNHRDSEEEDSSASTMRQLARENSSSICSSILRSSGERSALGASKTLWKLRARLLSESTSEAGGGWLGAASAGLTMRCHQWFAGTASTPADPWWDGRTDRREHSTPRRGFLRPTDETTDALLGTGVGAGARWWIGRVRRARHASAVSGGGGVRR